MNNLNALGSPPSQYELEHLTTLLQSLATDLVQARLSKPSPAAFDPAPYLTQSAPLFAALHATNRATLRYTTKDLKTKTQDARLKMDSSHLRLQNLLFERNHLEREIRKCEEFASEYMNLPLLPLDDLSLLASSPDPPAALSVPLPEDSHELMLVRLRFELSERQRLDEERKTLVLQKSRLVKENEAKKARLEELEQNLDKFVESARAIQMKMEGEDAVMS